MRERGRRREKKKRNRVTDRETETCFVTQACPELIMLSRLAPSCCSLQSAGITGVCHKPPQVFNSQAQVNATETWQTSLSYELSKFSLFKFYVGRCFPCMYVCEACVCSVCRIQIPQNWSYRQL